MTRGDFILVIAAISAALVMAFLPEESLWIFRTEIIRLCTVISSLMLALAGWDVYSICLNVFKRATKVVLTHQAIGLGEKIIDVIMVFLLLNYSVLITILIVTPIYFFYCLFIIRAYDYFLERGYDLLELENLRVNGQTTDFNRLLRWVLRRRNTIFLVGSFFQLDPDGVTILLRKNRKNFWGNAVRITLPSVLISMTVWTMTYCLAIRGYQLFDFEQATTVLFLILYLTVLGYEYYECFKK